MMKISLINLMATDPTVFAKAALNPPTFGFDA